MATLLALFGSKQGLRLPLAGTMVLGRAGTAAVQLVDGKVSREHCRLVVDGDRVTLEDLGSDNGTFVNGMPISGPVVLAPGDEIAVGDSLFVLDGDLDVLAARFTEATVCLAPSTPAPDAIRARGGDAAAGALAALARRLAGAADGEAVARTVVAALDETFAPDRAFLLAADEAGGVRPLAGKSQGASVAISRTLLELVRRERRALLIDDAALDREVQKARSVIKHGLRSVMIAPLFLTTGAGDRLIGYLHLDRNGPGAYHAGDLALLEGFAAITALCAPGRAAPSAPAALPTSERLVGDAPAFRSALRLMHAAARVDSAVLITGESGTGKEELARALHAASPRAAGPFVAVNCGAIPEALAESAFFGHQKGAFTGAAATHAGYFEAADGGTLFLDEVGELSPAVQAKLLRALQERLFFRLGSTTPRRSDVRVVAATHRDLEREVARGAFREDLYFRINVLRIELPALRDRPEDLVPLAEVLLARAAARLGRRAPGLAPSARAALARWRWPGNARELGNVLERLLVLREASEAEPIDGDEVNAALGRDPTPTAPGAALGDDATLGEKIVALERREIELALRRARGVKSHAAKALGLSRPTLDKKIADLGIDIWASEPR